MTPLSLKPRARAGQRHRSSISSRALTALAILALGELVYAPAAYSQNRFWITSTGGAFETAANWSTTAGGAGGASVPAAANVANFTLNSVYTVTYAANVTNAGLAVSNGTVTFDLGGRTYSVGGANAALIGTTLNQTGRLMLKNGILGVAADTDQISLGAAGSVGFLTITTGGRLGNGTVDPDIFVGRGGTATLMMDDNGRADVGILSIGHEATGVGTVTLNSPHVVLDVSETVIVGVNGTGTLNIQNGSTMQSAGTVRLGSVLGANGTATVTGLTSNWSQSSGLTVGDAGDGSLTVQAAATMNTAGAVVIGNAATSVGTAVVTGADSLWDATGTMHVGLSGLGNLLVTSGGIAKTAGVTTVAAAATGSGNVIVSGAGSRWNSAAVTVGGAGKANMTVSAGGVVNSNGNVTLASQSSAVSTAKVSGAGSAWNITGSLSVATLGTATLTVDSDAILSATGALSIGDPAGAQVGTLNLNGGAITAGSFSRAAGAAFNWTNGTLLVNGGAFNNGGSDLTINGFSLSDLPILRLAGGAQSLAANLPNLTIGSSRQGQLIVSGGSSFQTTTTNIGSQDGGTGVLHVEGSNSAFSTTADLGVGGTNAAAGGLGGVTIGPGGTVTAGGTLRLWSGGTVSLSGGTMRFSNLAANGGKFTFNSGTIEVQGAFNANAAALDALVGPTRLLGAGRRINSLTNAFNLQSDLNVTGGAIAGSTLSLSSGVIARVESAGAATFAAGIMNPAGARIFVTDGTLSAGTTFANGGELYLSGATATVNSTSVTNTGLISGSGRINSPITNNSAGQIRVQSGQRMEILGSSGTHLNNGLVDVDAGTIEFGRAVTNSNVSPSSGMIAARGATLRFNAGLSNSGALSFTAGVSDVFGDITNLNNLSTPGRIVVTGGAQANFFDDVVNNGSIQVSAAGTLKSTAVFLGSLSGSGVTGTGQVFIEGDARPGFSPGTMAFGGDVSFGPLSSLNIELAGTAPGTQYDRVTVAQTATLSGELNVTLLNNYRPAIGASFEIVSASGGLSGEFLSESLPELAGGANWLVGYGSNAVTLVVGGVLGDFNRDGRVDAADFSVWRDNFGTNRLAADASGNGTVDQADYNIWKANFGQVATSGGGSFGAVAAVPEPASWGLLCLALVGAMCSNRRAR